MKKIIVAIVLFSIPAHSQVQSSLTWDIEANNLATNQVMHYRPSLVSSTQLPSIQGWNCSAGQVQISKESDGSIWEKADVRCITSDKSIVGVWTVCRAFPNKTRDDETLSVIKGAQGFTFTLTCK